MARISIFDVGTLFDEVKDDEKKFGIKLEHITNSSFMGFETFEISGDGVQAFLDHYELELDPE